MNSWEREFTGPARGDEKIGAGVSIAFYTRQFFEIFTCRLLIHIHPLSLSLSLRLYILLMVYKRIILFSFSIVTILHPRSPVIGSSSHGPQWTESISADGDGGGWMGRLDGAQ